MSFKARLFYISSDGDLTVTLQLLMCWVRHVGTTWKLGDIISTSWVNVNGVFWNFSGSETHFKVVVVSSNFNDKPLIQVGNHFDSVVVFNPLYPNISMHILHTVLYTFPKVLVRRICITIKWFFVISWLSFPVFSWL